jgi:hypothetical protein
MATLGANTYSFMDMQKRMDPDGMPAQVAEVLSESMPILEDIPWMSSNMPQGHRSAIRTGLPTVYSRRINQGVLSSKSTVNQIEDSLSLLEAHATIDTKLLDIWGNAAATRFSESKAFIEAMGQEATRLLFYGDPTADPAEFQGFMPRYDDITLNTGDNIFDAGGTSADLASIWLIGWGADKVFGVYPKNTQAGLQHKDLGVNLIQQDDDLGGRKLEAFVDIFKWDLGLVVKDWRYAVRIASIEPDLVFDPSQSGQGLTDYTTNIMFLMERAIEHIPNLNACRPVFYMPRFIKEGLAVQALARTTPNVFKVDDVDGKKVTSYQGIPIKIVDALTNTESEPSE